MKNAFALLFSLVLIMTQTVFVSGQTTSAPQSGVTATCDCPHCPRQCCVTKNAPAEDSAPIAPARTISQTDWQVLLSITHHYQPRADCSPVFSSVTSVPSPAAAPLYQRNCCYLI
ncbi:MAG: hypothetical protein JWR26_4937 [Pedosphaera sp.]|jgi:hypothetical protein|nr:hypothetical protein [Pedosphaera sp.]